MALQTYSIAVQTLGNDLNRLDEYKNCTLESNAELTYCSINNKELVRTNLEESFF